MSKDTNKQAAEKLFTSTTHNILWANKKGEFFTSENIGSLSLKPGEKLEKFERTSEKEANEVPTVKPATADALIANTKSIATIEMAELAKDIEAKGKNRTTVIAAFDERIAELTAAIKVVGATAETGANGNEDTEGKK
jgi:hypothetical protein